MAHFHLPKPLHGWREFAGEVGIIVLGVLIALGAEQVAERFEWQRRVADAEAAMAKELGDDDGAQAQSRLALSPCFSGQLAKLERGLIDERDRGTPFVPSAVVAPPFRTWDDNAWHAAISSTATLHMSTARMYRWSAPYAFIPDMSETAVRESSDWADLERIRLLRPHPSEQEREAMLTAISRARHDNAFLTRLSQYLLIFTGFTGVHVSEEASAGELRRQRKEMGTC